MFKLSIFDMKFINIFCKMVNYKYNKWILFVVMCIGLSCELLWFLGYSGGGGCELMLFYYWVLCGYFLWCLYLEDWK